MTRHPDWLARVTAVIDAWRARPYDVVRATCLHLMRDAVMAVVDDDPLPVYARPLPESLEDVARWRRDYGGTEGIAAHYFGPAEAPLLARTGDLALLPADHDQTIGVVIGDRVLCATPLGLHPFPLAEATGCFRVGEA